MITPDTLLQNRYLIVRLLAQGGMGAVYLAQDQRLGSQVALKETFFNDDMLRRAFEREARLLANLRHPALPRVIDHFSEESGQFLVMDFIPGNDLMNMMKHRDQPFPLNDIMTWADQILDALHYLHTQRPPIIHRDIKPQNLKLTPQGNIILLDFGLAKGSVPGMSLVSTPNSILGYTLSYAPLEQIQGQGTDPRSDLYSIAATMYHLMTGITPSDALTRASALIHEEPDPLKPAHELNPLVPPSVSSLLMKAMAQNRSHRPSTAAEMRSLLREAYSYSKQER